MSDFYTVVVVFIENQAQEIITSLIETAISRHNCRGAEEFNLSEPAVDTLLGERSYSGGDLPLDVLQEVDRLASRGPGIKFYFDGNDANIFAKQFSDHVIRVTGQIPLIESHATEDWNVTWRKHFRPIVVSDILTIVPSWESENWHSPQNAIFIYPGQGFGTGNHETTFLCLKALCHIVGSEYLKNDSMTIKVLDFGCGSAILGIAAGLLLGNNSSIDLYDIDPTAIENAHQNINSNPHIGSIFQTYLPAQRIKLKNDYEIVFANILAPILEEEADFLTSVLSKEGYLILSGLLLHQMDEIEKKYLSIKGTKLVERLTKGDWGCLVFQKS